MNGNDLTIQLINESTNIKYLRCDPSAFHWSAKPYNEYHTGPKNNMDYDCYCALQGKRVPFQHFLGFREYIIRNQW